MEADVKVAVPGTWPAKSPEEEIAFIGRDKRFYVCNMVSIYRASEILRGLVPAIRVTRNIDVHTLASLAVRCEVEIAIGRFRSEELGPRAAYGFRQTLRVAPVPADQLRNIYVEVMPVLAHPFDTLCRGRAGGNRAHGPIGNEVETPAIRGENGIGVPPDSRKGQKLRLGPLPIVHLRNTHCIQIVRRNGAREIK
jgi:hypothetical protein